jgi:hypothetical protein
MAPFSPSWTAFCPHTGIKHGNALSCGSCLAQNPDSPLRTGLFKEEDSIDTTDKLEIINLIDSPPPVSRATAIFATRKDSTPTETGRFSKLSRTNGAEDLRQASITRTKTSGSPKLGVTVSATIIFHLVVEKRDTEGIPVTQSCKVIGKFKLCFFLLIN